MEFLEFNFGVVDVIIEKVVQVFKVVEVVC